jgi:gas vesicle protein
MFRDESGSSTLVSFLLGGLTGASIAVLLTPRSGAEARREIEARGRDLVQRGRDLGARVSSPARAAGASLRVSHETAPPVGTSFPVPEPAVTTPPPSSTGLA